MFPMHTKLVIATGNRGKIAEIARLLDNIPGWELLTPDRAGPFPEVFEDGATFEENAVKKARELCAHTGHAAVADDSGLEVDALGGRPGVFSARYAGDNATDADRNAKLLREMNGVPEGKRTARFVCVIALALPDERLYLARGVCEGSIAREPRGSAGFGYDPVFVPAGRTVAMAELSPDEKNAISHRGAALRELRSILSSLNVTA